MKNVEKTLKILRNPSKYIKPQNETPAFGLFTFPNEEGRIMYEAYLNEHPRDRIRELLAIEQEIHGNIKGRFLTAKLAALMARDIGNEELALKFEKGSVFPDNEI